MIIITFIEATDKTIHWKIQGRATNKNISTAYICLFCKFFSAKVIIIFPTQTHIFPYFAKINNVAISHFYGILNNLQIILKATRDSSFFASTIKGKHIRH